MADLDGAGRRDVLFSSSEANDEVVWYQQPAGGLAGTWTRRVILPAANGAHTLWAADVVMVFHVTTRGSRIRAGGRNRTDDRQFTKLLLYH